MQYILEDGKPVAIDDVLKWGAWFEEDDNRRVAEDEVGEARISTVFLGLDHSFGSGPPVLWETMIFGGEHDEYQERYTSRIDAENGHLRAIQLVKSPPIERE